MTYPKPVMSVSEMAKLGFSKDFLYQAINSRWGSTFSRKTSSAKNAKIYIDTEKFNKLYERGVFE
ncbi:MAG: hypothetical protein E7242_00945 [Lachnospiraceae bacterium]|nr:hypothetical protein [Lachnospiraceae bacterium]